MTQTLIALPFSLDQSNTGSIAVNVCSDEVWLWELAVGPGDEDPFKEDWEAWLSEPLKTVSA